MLDEVREAAHLREFAAKQRVAQRYNSKVTPKEMQQSNLVLRKMVKSDGAGKLSTNWESPYRITKNLSTGAYKLEDL